MAGAYLIRPPARLCQAAFAAAVAVVLLATLWPKPLASETANLDKAYHFAAFYLLELLALAAFRARIAVPAVSLVLLGGAIEVLQGLTGRDCSLADLVADSLGVAAALLPLIAVWLRSPDAWRQAPRSS